MKSRILVLHSGMSGDACECAFCVAGKLLEDHHPVIVADFDKYLASHILTERTVLICLENSPASPPAQLLDFVDFLGSLETGSLRRLQYSVINVRQAARGCWQDLSRQIDALLEGLGALRVAQRMDCRPHFHDHLHVWAETVSTVLSLRREVAAT